MNPCVKTGATVVLPSSQWWHGDLFDLGDYFMLNCNAPTHRGAPPKRSHMEVWTWQAELQDGKVILFHKGHVAWFDYEGRAHEQDA